MSTATKARIYDAAEAQDIRVRNLDSPTNGRSWNYELHDLRHPERGPYKGYRDTTDQVIGHILIWGGRHRESHERQQEALKQAQADAAIADAERLKAEHLAAQEAEANSLDKLIAAGLPEEATAPAPAFPEVIELPGDEQAAYEDGYNAGLTEGLALAGEGAPTIAHTSVTMSDQETYDAGYHQAELDHAEAVAEAVEQARRRFTLDQANSLERERIEAFEAGKEEGANGLADAIEAATKTLLAENTALKAAIADLKQGLAGTAAYGDASLAHLQQLVRTFAKQADSFSMVGTDAVRDKELEYQTYVDRVVATRLKAAQDTQEAA